MNYYISDLHLFHGNVLSFDNRPFENLDEMHEAIKMKWNARVTGADHVYILGDMCWKENEEAISYVSTLKGNKHLILGNHDKVKDQRYRRLFDEVAPYKEITDILDGKQVYLTMSHYPIMFWNHQHKLRRDGSEHKNYSIHLYGHVHNSVEESIFQKFIGELNTKENIQCEAYNVGCMLHGYAPCTIEEIIVDYKLKQKFDWGK